MSSKGPQKEEVVVLAGVRARMAAYQQNLQRKGKVKKSYTPVFKVEEDLGADKEPVEEEPSLSQIDPDDEDAHHFERSMNRSVRVEFQVTDEEILLEEEEEEAEKPQEIKDEEEKVAKEKIGKLLGPDEKDAEPTVLQAFTSVQRRYLKAVKTLRPKPFEMPPPPKEETRSQKTKEAAEEEAAKETKEVIRKTLDRELTKSRHLTELTTTWDDYYDKAQDKPTEEKAAKKVEQEIKQVEEEVNSEWAEFADEVVEIVGEPKEGEEEDSDMVKWREEARRLKAEAVERKKQKAAREERRKKRAHIAALRKKRAAEAAAKKKAEQEEAKRAEEAAAEAAKKAEADQRKEERKKKSEGSDSESSDSSGSSSSGEKGKGKPPSSPKGKKKSVKVKHQESDSESSVEDSKTKKKKSKKKKEKEKEKKKEKDIVKVKEKKSAKKKKDSKKKGDDESDLDDGWVEEYPRNFDGTLWRNPLKFWTNKPQKLNEVAPKVIMRPNPNTDIFCKSEDAINDNAAFYWHKFEGDFNVLVKIKGSFRTSYDKAGIMIRQDERNWVMSGLEFFNKRINHSSCITRGISDWSLAPLPDEAKDGIWIAVKRHGNKVECFYSYDLKEWIQTRQGLFPTTSALKVGIMAACPMGEPFKVVFERFRIQMVG